jgi:hypothetical protein
MASYLLVLCAHNFRFYVCNIHIPLNDCLRYVGVFPDFNEHLDSRSVGTINKNMVSMQIGATSMFLNDVSVSNILETLVYKSPSITDMQAYGLKYHFDFSNSSVQRSLFHTCFMDHARQRGLERDALKALQFDVCAFFGPNSQQRGLITTSPFVISDATLQNFTNDRALKSRGWTYITAGFPKPLAGINFMVRSREGAFLYSQCSSTLCRDSIWSFSPTFTGGSWKQINVVLAPTSGLLSISDVPSFKGPTVQYQNHRLYVIGGKMHISSGLALSRRFTVAAVDLNEDGSQATMKIFVYDEFSCVIDASSTSNGTHAFIFGGSVGWGRPERTVLILSYALMSVEKITISPTSPPAALFSAVLTLDFQIHVRILETSPLIIR